MLRLIRSFVLLILIGGAFYSCQSSFSQKGEQSSEMEDTAGHIIPVTEDTIAKAAKVVPDTIKAAVDTIAASKEVAAKDTGSVSKKFIPVWPVKGPKTLPGALLPKHRIITFYGNLYSKRMGILGELQPEQMLKQLQKEAKKWQEADSTKEVMPALQLIVVTAQGKPGRDSLYNQKMPSWMMDSVIDMANSINGQVILDIQVGASTVEKEVGHFDNYLKLPNVHLGIDPEFSMKKGNAPGTRIGGFNASDINYCAQHLASIVNQYHLPPKLLVVHRFTQQMVRDYKDIKLRPEVQIIMNMDGWGSQSLKEDTYRRYIYKEPVQYTGFKLFYKNDTKNNQRLMTPKEVLNLKPQPLYIQYQ